MLLKGLSGDALWRAVTKKEPVERTGEDAKHAMRNW